MISHVRIVYEMAGRREFKVPDAVHYKIRSQLSQLDFPTRFGPLTKQTALDIRDAVQEMLRLHREQVLELGSASEAVIRAKDVIERNETEYRLLEEQGVSD